MQKEKVEATDSAEEILREEIDQLGHQVEKLEAEKERLTSKCAGLEEQVRRLESLVTTSSSLGSRETLRQRQVWEIAQSDIARLKRHVAELEKQVETEADEYAELAATLDQAQVACTQEKEARTKLEQEKALLHEQLLHTEREAAGTTAELTRTRHRKRILEKECVLLHSQFREVEKQGQSIAQEWETMNAKAGD